MTRPVGGPLGMNELAALAARPVHAAAASDARQHVLRAVAALAAALGSNLPSVHRPAALASLEQITGRAP